MSQYLECQTEFTDPNLLISALTEMGFTPEYHKDKPQHLYGYHGDQRKDVAHIIVRRSQLSSASNDVGFVLKEDGKYHAIISQFDQNTHWNQARQSLLTKTYAVHKHIATARNKGYLFLGREQNANGEIKLRFGVR